MPVTKVRHVRIDDDLWGDSRATAADQGEKVAQFINRALRAYVSDPNATNAALAQIRGAGQ